MSQKDTNMSQDDAPVSSRDKLVEEMAELYESLTLDPMSQKDTNTSPQDNSTSRDAVDESQDDDEMSQDDEPIYSRDEIVKEVTEFYEFLAGLHVRKEDLLYPPDGGWPEIDAKQMAWFGKTDVVVDLMRHLPYICKDDDMEGPEIYPMTSPVDYRGHSQRKQNCPGWVTEYGWGIEYQYPRPPPYILTLASQTTRDGCFVLIDTRRGTATLYDPMVGSNMTLGESTCKGPEEDEEEDQDWTNFCIWRVSEFFERLKAQFISLRWVPQNKYRVWGNQGSEDLKAKIYREYGWPEPIEKQEECLQKIEQLDWAEFERT